MNLPPFEMERSKEVTKPKPRLKLGMEFVADSGQTLYHFKLEKTVDLTSYNTSDLSPKDSS